MIQKAANGSQPHYIPQNLKQQKQIAVAGLKLNTEQLFVGITLLDFEVEIVQLRGDPTAAGRIPILNGRSFAKRCSTQRFNY